jgi:hypothetical protein
VDEEGSTDSTLGRTSRKFSGVEASRRAGLVRVGTRSRAPRSSYVCGLDRRICVGGALIRLFRGFSRRGSLRDLLLLIVGFGYP